MHGIMSDGRRVRVPWYSQRWYLRYLLPAAVLWVVAGSALFDLRKAPIGASAIAVFCGLATGMLTRIAWRERLPLRKSTGSDQTG